MTTATILFESVEAAKEAFTTLKLMIDLPKGQLAEATITGFDDSGKPNAATIYIDHDANGVG